MCERFTTSAEGTTSAALGLWTPSAHCRLGRWVCWLTLAGGGEGEGEGRRMPGDAPSVPTLHADSWARPHRLSLGLQEKPAEQPEDIRSQDAAGRRQCQAAGLMPWAAAGVSWSGGVWRDS